jgi:fumarate reductase flavoprotein subunit
VTDVDVVIAGAGAAGLFAALAAAETGRSVMVIERDPRFAANANTARSTGIVTAGGTKQQILHGVTDSPDQYALDLLHKNRGDAPIDVVTAVARGAPRVVDGARTRWHAPLDFIPDLAFPGHSVNRAHGPAARKGRFLIDALMQAVRERPSIQFVEGMTVRGLITDKRNSVIGLTASPASQLPEPVTAEQVILAVNGFGSNVAWVRRFIPEIAGAIYFGGPYSDGSGIRMGLDVGAATTTMDAYQGHCSISPDAGTLIPFAVLASGGVMVNLSGARFGDESLGYSEFATSVVSQPENRAWTVFDGESYATAAPYEDFQESVNAGVVLQGDGLSEIAARTRLPLRTLEAEVSELSESVRSGQPDRYGRVHRRHLQPPLFAVRVAAALFHTQGGLLIDASARVLRTNGRPIRGLYAAGGTAAGISGHGAGGYMAGNGLTAAAVLGYVAGSADTR